MTEKCTYRLSVTDTCQCKACQQRRALIAGASAMGEITKNYRETYGKEDNVFAVALETLMVLEAVNKGSSLISDGSGILKVENQTGVGGTYLEINIEELRTVFKDAMSDAGENRKLKIELNNTKSFLNLAVEFLSLFRGFVQRNARVWVLGSNHHHPMWMSIAELIKTYNDSYPNKVDENVDSGPRYQFITPNNTETLDTLIEKDRQRHGLAS